MTQNSRMFLLCAFLSHASASDSSQDETLAIEDTDNSLLNAKMAGDDIANEYQCYQSVKSDGESQIECSQERNDSNNSDSGSGHREYHLGSGHEDGYKTESERCASSSSSSESSEYGSKKYGKRRFNGQVNQFEKCCCKCIIYKKLDDSVNPIINGRITTKGCKFTIAKCNGIFSTTARNGCDAVVHVCKTSKSFRCNINLNLFLNDYLQLKKNVKEAINPLLAITAKVTEETGTADPPIAKITKHMEDVVKTNQDIFERFKEEEYCQKMLETHYNLIHSRFQFNRILDIEETNKLALLLFAKEKKMYGIILEKIIEYNATTYGGLLLRRPFSAILELEIFRRNNGLCEITASKFDGHVYFNISQEYVYARVLLHILDVFRDRLDQSFAFDEQQTILISKIMEKPIPSNIGCRKRYATVVNIYVNNLLNYMDTGRIYKINQSTDEILQIYKHIEIVCVMLNCHLGIRGQNLTSNRPQDFDLISAFQKVNIIDDSGSENPSPPKKMRLTDIFH